MQDVIEIAVIGAGPCGLSVGVSAVQQGVGCVIFDKGCITRCIAGYPTYGSFFSTADKLELGGLPFITVSEKPTRHEALKYYRRVVGHFDLDVRQYEEVVEVAAEPGGGFSLRTHRMDGSSGEYRAAHIVDATGYWDHPNLLGVPGEDLPKVTHYYREGLPYFGQDVLVVGGGNSAVESALDLYRAGARVTLAHFLSELDGGVKPWVLPDILGRFRNGEIRARFRHRVLEIRPKSVLLRSEDEGLEEIENDFVFAMTGYTPDPWMLRDLGVAIHPETLIPAHDPQTMETDVPGVFLAGVVAGGNRPNKIFIESGRDHGPRIVRAVVNASSSVPGAPAR